MLVAAVTAYGGPEVIELQSRPIPVPREDEVLVKIAATTVNSGDARMRALRVPKGLKTVMRLAMGITRPRRPVFGTELSGTVVAVGRAVTGFKLGDDVIAFAGMGMGCHAQFKVISEKGALAHKPPLLSHRQAAALCFGGTTAMDYLRKANLKPGERILVIGASGTVGSAIVQLARLRDAVITAVTSTGNIDTMRGLGADEVIDYRTEDYTQARNRWDVIADTVGVTHFRTMIGALTPGGRYLAIAGGVGDMLARGRDGKSTIAGPAAERPEDVLALARLAEEGKFVPLIDSVYPLEEIAAAHARVDTGHKRGSVVVTMPA